MTSLGHAKVKADDQKTIGAEMPQAFAIYEKSDGQVYVNVTFPRLNPLNLVFINRKIKCRAIAIRVRNA
ncbi:MAG: hypothetical protein AUK44_06385 [Porphyromonadaceae bacterium CG2_30_38_12]|nr:MAG: hypothetical protein AUK44_06385 [Porphyromonadaceae bacterium CG2_30_38_12]